MRDPGHPCLFGSAVFFEKQASCAADSILYATMKSPGGERFENA